MHGDFAKQKNALRYWLLGRGWFTALRAMDCAENLHRGVRKDGITPEFAHQVWIANFIRTLTPHLPKPEAAIAIGLLHDAGEDYGLTLESMLHDYGPDIAEPTWRLTKIRNGIKLPNDVYYAGLAEDPDAALVKGVDRTHNMGSMVGVFTREKQVEQIVETREFVLPMLKIARRRFPERELAFENIKQILLTRISLIEAIHAAGAAA